MGKNIKKITINKRKIEKWFGGEVTPIVNEGGELVMAIVRKGNIWRFIKKEDILKKITNEKLEKTLEKISKEVDITEKRKEEEFNKLPKEVIKVLDTIAYALGTYFDVKNKEMLKEQNLKAYKILEHMTEAQFNKVMELIPYKLIEEYRRKAREKRIRKYMMDQKIKEKPKKERKFTPRGFRRK